MKEDFYTEFEEVRLD